MTNAWAGGVVEATVAALVPLADPVRAEPMRRYMKDVAPFLGIATPERREAGEAVNEVEASAIGGGVSRVHRNAFRREPGLAKRRCAPAVFAGFERDFGKIR